MSWQVAAMIVAAVGAVEQIQTANDAAQAQMDAAAADRDAAITEINRQQGETNRQAREQKSDRMRQAEADLAKARSASAEGFGMLGREVGELGYLEGLDLSRIESNRAAQWASLESRKDAAKRGAANTIGNAQRTAAASADAAVLGAIGAGVQIKARQEAYDSAIERAKNRNPGLQTGN